MERRRGEVKTEAKKWWEKTEAELEAATETALMAIGAMEAAKNAELAAWAKAREQAEYEALWAEKEIREAIQRLIWARAKE